MLERTIRPSPVTGIRIDPVLSAVLIAELLAPSPELWLVSPWVSDVTSVDNTRGDYDSLFPDAAVPTYSLSDVLSLLTSSGSALSVVTRPDERNSRFLSRLQRQAVQNRLQLVQHPDIHEKTFCGRNWLLTGSMNFTQRGMQLNDEAVTYKVSEASAAQARIDFTRRWRDLR